MPEGRVDGGLANVSAYATVALSVVVGVDSVGTAHGGAAWS